VTMRPVVQTSYTAIDTGCNSCAGQATYTTPVDTGCSSCADDYSYSTPAASTSGDFYGPETPQPSLGNGLTPTPAEARYGDGAEETDTSGSEQPADASADFGAPALLDPLADQVTRRPSVDVRHAVYRRPTSTANVSSQPSPEKPRGDAPRNVDGWHSVH